MSDNSVTKRLLSLMQDKGIKKADLARAADVTPQAAGKWFKKNSISNTSLIKIALKYDFSLNYLLTGKEIVCQNQTRETTAEYVTNLTYDKASHVRLDTEIVVIHFYVEIEEVAGITKVVQVEKNEGNLKFSKSVLESKGIAPENVTSIKIKGNSMEPVIPDGSIVAIDIQNQEIVDGDMYAIDWGGTLHVKTLVRRPNRELKIKSFNNKDYPDENLTTEESKNIRILGRVFWHSTFR